MHEPKGMFIGKCLFEGLRDARCGVTYIPRRHGVKPGMTQWFKFPGSSAASQSHSFDRWLCRLACWPALTQ